MSEILKILFIGDIVGESGLSILEEYLPKFKEKYNPNVIIANGENADKGKGLTEKESDRIFALGVNVITTGNHIWDNWKSKPLLANNSNILRPYNYPAGNPGMGYAFHKLKNGKSVAVINLQGRTFMQTINCPFKAMDNLLKTISEMTNLIIVDFHAETTAEKIAMTWYLDGKVSAILGTHTHIQTSDACIYPNGTAFISDVGMTGPYNSVVGLRTDIALKRFILQTPQKFEIASGDDKISGVFLEIDTETGKSINIEPFVEPEFKRKIN